MTNPALRTQLAYCALALSVCLAGCTAMTAQNPSSSLKPVNAVADGEDPRVILKGADVVAYFTQGRFQQGERQFTTLYQAVAFRFASAEHKALFDQEPARYLPQFGGYCANGIAYAIPWGGDADTWKIVDGKLYVFGGQASKDAFELDEKANLERAHRYWTDEVAGRNSFVQRIWRLVFRVPHYKSGEDLAKSVAEAKARAR